MRIPLPSISGTLDFAVGTDFNVAYFSQASIITELYPTVLTAPSGGNFVVELRTAAGQLPATILDGNLSPATPASGNLAVAAGETVQMRITASNGARDLSGYYDTDAQDPDTVTGLLTTLTLVKQYAGITDGTHDVMLNDLIRWVSRQFVTFCGRPFAITTVQAEIHDGSGPYLFPHSYPVDESTLVVVEGENTLATDEYRVIHGGRTIQRVSSGSVVPLPFIGGEGSISLDYDAGYAVIPDDVVMAATKQTVYEFGKTNAGGDRLGMLQKTQASGAVSTYEVAGLLPEVVDVLRPYQDEGVLS